MSAESRDTFDPRTGAIGETINALYLSPESEILPSLCERASVQGDLGARIQRLAIRLVEQVRARRAGVAGLDAFLQEYDLSSREGVALMCLAEALLRIPDADTADALIADKLRSGDWATHSGESESLFVNASTWGLMLTGRLIDVDDDTITNPAGFMQSLAARLGEPVVRGAMRQAMRIMGHQFVMGRDIAEAIHRSGEEENARYRYSYDMLGEAALTHADADRYHSAYRAAIDAIGSGSEAGGHESRPSISVKLSALYPRFEYLRSRDAVSALIGRVSELVDAGQRQDVPVTIDAEEADRLEMSLAVFERVYREQVTAGWDGFGLAVQAYQKRAPAVIRWLRSLAAGAGRRIPVRLVKGAYWDTEIKRAQELGLPGYPVYTRKRSTDVSYLACLKDLAESEGQLYPQIATHNAHTAAYAIHVIANRVPYEFQRLHGMGEELYESITDEETYDIPCRVYAPVGRHEDLLPYLVRRLLENGANTSFVNRIVDEAAPVEDIVADPVEAIIERSYSPHPAIPLPVDLYAPDRANSSGLNLADAAITSNVFESIDQALGPERIATPVIDGEGRRGYVEDSVNPANHLEIVGRVEMTDERDVAAAITSAVSGQREWDRLPVAARADILRAVADAFEASRSELMALCVKEAGKTITDAVAEVREAVDFLRYYAFEAERLMSGQTRMPGPTGEENLLGANGRGTFACISPWNFPLAIFTGQVAAALATGNSVIAKPAEQTSLTAARAVSLMHSAGVPVDVLHFLPGHGESTGQRIVEDPRISGVAFTGSTGAAMHINRTLAARNGPIGTLIAETGGQNAMLVDSSALPEQVVADIVQSAFNSAGQRCSALRVLMIQEDVADRTLEMLYGFMRTLVIGYPLDPITDIGPVIDFAARDRINDHIGDLAGRGFPVESCDVPKTLKHGSFIPPTVIEISDISIIKEEVFGPVLHVIRIPGDGLDAAVDAINGTGFGLTMGIHSRIEGRAKALARRAMAGNVYVNRNMIGAVVGVQPFGGRGLSGTGPKAGGPHYLSRFVSEQSISTNTAAVGGNASLMALAGFD